MVWQSPSGRGKGCEAGEREEAIKAEGVGQHKEWTIDCLLWCGTAHHIEGNDVKLVRGRRQWGQRVWDNTRNGLLIAGSGVAQPIKERKMMWRW